MWRDCDFMDLRTTSWLVLIWLLLSLAVMLIRT